EGPRRRPEVDQVARGVDGAGLVADRGVAGPSVEGRGQFGRQPLGLGGEDAAEQGVAILLDLTQPLPALAIVHCSTPVVRPGRRKCIIPQRGGAPAPPSIRYLPPPLR